MFGFESIAWPLSPGRDAGTYLTYYADMWNAHPLYPQLMLFRTPLAPLVFGPLLDLGGPPLAEAAMALLYAASVACFARAASIVGSRCAVATALLLLIYPPYGALFHQVSSDPVFAGALAAFVLQLARLWQRPSHKRAAVAALLVLALVLARPSGEVLVALAPGLLLLRAPFRRRVAIAATFAVASVGLVVSFAAYNDVRYGDFTTSRLGAALVPFYRVFATDRIVEPTNGAASRRLAAAVRSDLLPYRPYSAYGIDLRTFFSSGSDRMYSDLVVLSDRVWGWQSGYRILRDAGLEAIRRHPRAYIDGVVSTLKTQASLAYSWPAPVADTPHRTSGPAQTIVIHGRRVPTPTEGQPIPASRLWWLASTPRQTLWTDWSSLAHPVLRSREPGGDLRIASLERRTAGLLNRVPDRSGSVSLARGLNWIARHYPSPRLWVLVGLIGFAIARGRSAAFPGLLAVGSALLIVGTSLGEPAVLEYRLPFDPVFVFFGVAGLAAAIRARPFRGRAS